MEKSSKKGQPNNSLEEVFGEVLKKLRKERGLTQEALSLESGYHRTYIGMLEQGKKSPSLKTIFRLAQTLHIRPSELIESIQKIRQTKLI